MERTEFLKTCAGGLCGCAGLSLFSGNSVFASDVANEKDDWRIGFIQKRYAKMIALLGDKLGPEVRNEILEQMGRECAKEFRGRAEKFKGNLEGYLEDIQKDWFEKAEFDKENQVVRITDRQVKSCACPFVDKSLMTGAYCNCTIGWQKENYSFIVGREVNVEIESSVLRGDSKCVYRITLK